MSYYFNYKRFLFMLFGLLFIVKVNGLFEKSFKISFIDVGQGDSSIIISPGRKEVVMIDTGGIISYNSNASYLMENIILYLKFTTYRKMLC